MYAGAPPQIAVLSVDWPKYLERYGVDRCPALYADLAQERKQGAKVSPAAARPALTQALDGARPAERWERLLAHVSAQVGEVLGFTHGFAIDVEKGFFDLGMDSLTAVELKNRLQVSAGCALPSAVVFDYPSVKDLSTYLARHVLSWDEFPVMANTISTTNTADTGPDDNYSEDELAALLSKKLEQLR